MAGPQPTSGAPPEEKIALPRRAVEKLIKELFMARDKGWQVSLSADDGLPKMLVAVVDKLLAAVREQLEAQNTQLSALGHANMRALFLSEALTRLNEIDETGKQSPEAKKKSYCDALNEIMCAASARVAVLFFVDGRGLITELYCQGFGDNNAHHSNEYISMLEGLTGGFIANEFKSLIINASNDLLAAIKLPANHPSITNFIATPVTFNNNKQVRGVLYFANKPEGEVFDDNEKMLSDLFLREITNVRERMRLTRQLQHEKEEQSRLVKEIKQTQEQLLQAEKMASVGQLAAGVAHEINNPVGYINSNIATLQNYLTDIFTLLDQYQAIEEFLPDDKRQAIADSRKKSDLEFMSQDVDDLVRESIEGITRVKQIVNDLNNFSRVDKVEWALSDINKGLDSTLNIATSEIKYKADVVKQYGELPLVWCIASQLNQVILNLLVNAAHALKEHGTITITTRCLNPDQVQLSVADTGCGIPEANLSKIFDPFFTSKPVGQGTGLGLSLSYGIIEKHHGKIEVASTVSKGTVFTITLPVKQPEKQ